MVKIDELDQEKANSIIRKFHLKKLSKIRWHYYDWQIDNFIDDDLVIGEWENRKEIPDSLKLGKEIEFSNYNLAVNGIKPISR